MDRLMMMIDLFPQETVDYMTSLEQAVGQRDGPQIRSMAHVLKGVAGSLSASQLQATAEAMEGAASSDAENMATLYGQLDYAYRQFCERIEQEKNTTEDAEQEKAATSAAPVNLSQVLPLMAARLEAAEYIDPEELSAMQAGLSKPDELALMDQLRKQLMQLDNQAALQIIKQWLASTKAH
ncbi:hypothetical protein BST96_13920 [Oceanicoccus sagamiensis]|uniref:HPt domain-containing protein n=2 Tax=Oceanicoccus sagamiensis TaxID=716816 RepID=A0A1X9NGZ8_9GAMM|nr:hypothetical protein BST96_13920 [Oceanicoccus sagamiensis]